MSRIARTYRRAWLVALVTLTAACAGRPELLNSERIEARFGSYGVEILAQDDRERRSSLFSREPVGRVTRTFALVQFADSSAPELREQHGNVIDGASLGAAFRSAGFSVRKISRHIGCIKLPPSHPIARLMQLGQSQTLAMHVYRLDLERDGRSWEYATITEVHHPDYLDVEKLRSLYRVSRNLALDRMAIEELVHRVLDQHWQRRRESTIGGGARLVRRRLVSLASGV